MSFRENLLARAAARRRKIVLCEGADPRVAEAAAQLRRHSIVEPIVLGGASPKPADDPRLGRVAAFLRERRPDRIQDGVHALDVASDPVNFGAALVALGEADGAVAGAVVPTADTIRAALWAIGTAPGVRLVSSAFYMVLPGDTVYTFTDCAVVPDPSPAELAEIALAAARDRARLVGDSPRVAFLSYSTKGSADGPRVARRCGKRRRGFGSWRPISRPTARSRRTRCSRPVWESARRRVPRWPGGPTCWFFPISTPGNIAYKLVQRLAGAVAIGPILQGLARPMADLSRGATADDIVEVAAMVALQCDSTT